MEEVKSYCTMCEHCRIEKNGDDVEMSCAEGIESQFLREYGCAFFKESDSYERIYGEDHEGHWISVKDRLPQPFTQVIVAYDNGTVDSIGWQDWENGASLEYACDDDWEKFITVTHWMPMPKAPGQSDAL